MQTCNLNSWAFWLTQSNFSLEIVSLMLHAFSVNGTRHLPCYDGLLPVRCALCPSQHHIKCGWSLQKCQQGLCPNLSLDEAMPRLFMMELCLTWYSPDLREHWSEVNMLCARSKTHSWADTRHTLLTPLRLMDISLNLLRTIHKSGLDEMITIQDLNYEQLRKCVLFIIVGQIHRLCICRFHHFNASGIFNFFSTAGLLSWLLWLTIT